MSNKYNLEINGRVGRNEIIRLDKSISKFGKDNGRDTGVNSHKKWISISIDTHSEHLTHRLKRFLQINQLGRSNKVR